MPGRRQTIRIPFVKGIDQKTDDLQIANERLSGLINGRFDSIGAINKRPGSIEQGGPLTESRMLARRGNSLLAADNGRMYQRFEAGRQWVDIGPYLGMRLGEESVKTVTTDFSTTVTERLIHCDSAVVGGIEFITYTLTMSSSSLDRKVFYMAREIHSGAVVIPPTSPWSGFRTGVRLTPLSGTNLIAGFALAPTYAGIIIFNAETLAVDITLGGSLGLTAPGGEWNLDIADAGGGEFAVVYSTGAGASTVYKFDSTPSITQGPTNLSLAGYDHGYGIDVAPDGTVCVIGADNNDLDCWRYNSSLVLQARTDLGTFTQGGTPDNPPVTCKFKSTANGSGYYDLYVLWGNCDYDIGADLGVDGIIIDTNDTTYTLPMFDGRSTYHMGIGSKWLEDDATGQMMIWITHTMDDGNNTGLFAPTTVLVGEDGDCYARSRSVLAKRTGYSAGDEDFLLHVPYVSRLGEGSFRVSMMTRLSLVDFEDAIRGVSAVSWETEDVSHRDSAEVEGITLFTGGLLWQTDGNFCGEHNFLTMPIDVNATTVAGGSLDTNSSYSYRIYYERVLANGRRERSANFGAVTQSTTANRTIRLTIPTLCLTNTRGEGQVYIAIYRTENDPSGDSYFYRVGTIENDPTVDTVQFDDDLADSAIIDNDPDPYSLGVVENVCANPAHIIAAGRSRVFTSDGEWVQYSKTTDGGRPVEFSDIYKIDADQPGGEITGLAVMDDVLVVFLRNAIYGIAGSGPDNLGNGAFAEPQLIDQSIGCSCPTSVINVPEGVMFMDDKGVYLLARDLTVKYIGSAVDDYRGQTVRDAVLIENKNEVRMLMAGETLVYDYLVGEWGVDSRTGEKAVYLRNSEFFWVNDGKLYKEGGFLDDGQPYTLDIKTGWIKIEHLQDFWHADWFHLIGRYKDKCQLKVRVAIDYDETFVWEYTIDFTEEACAAFQRRARFNRQRLQAVKFHFQDINAWGESYSLSELAIQYRSRAGNYRFAKTVKGEKI